MKKLRLATVLVALVACLMAAMPSATSAQNFQSAWGRNYVPGPTTDPNVMLVQTIGFSFGEGKPILEGMLQQFGDGFAGGYFGDAATVPTGTPVDGIGDEALSYKGTNTFAGTEAEVSLIVWSQNDAIFIVSGIGTDATAADSAAMLFVDFISAKLGGTSTATASPEATQSDLAATDLLGTPDASASPSATGTIDLNGAVNFMDDGTSTGGMYDAFPTATDNVGGMVPNSDTNYTDS